MEYTPRSFEDLIGQETVVEQLCSFKELPSILLLVGENGSGKDTILRLVYERWLNEYPLKDPSVHEMISTNNISILYDVCKSSQSNTVWKISEYQRLPAKVQRELVNLMTRLPQSYFLLTAPTKCDTDTGESIDPKIYEHATVIELEPVTPDDVAKLLKIIVDRNQLTTDANVLKKIVGVSENNYRLASGLLSKVAYRTHVTPKDIEVLAALEEASRPHILSRPNVYRVVKH